MVDISFAEVTIRVSSISGGVVALAVLGLVLWRRWRPSAGQPDLSTSLLGASPWLIILGLLVANGLLFAELLRCIRNLPPCPFCP